MVMISERPTAWQTNLETLGRRAERDLSETLAEFSQESQPRPIAATPQPAAPGFGYGIPMPGVRYYSYL